MANVSLDWEIEGIIRPEESVSKMLKVIPTKNIEQSGTFWTWEGKVSLDCINMEVANNFKGVPLVTALPAYHFEGAVYCICLCRIQVMRA